MSITADVDAATVAAMAADEGLNRHTVQVGARTYVVQTLTAQRFGLLGSLILRESQAALQSGLADLQTDLQQTNLTTLAGQIDAVLRFWERLPATFGQAMTLILSCEHPEDDAPYLIAHLEPVVILDILEHFMDVNHWEDLVERFFKIRGRLQRALQRAEQGHP